MQLLFEAGELKIYDSDFAKGLRLAGVREGDVIFVHSDIAVFGKLALFDRQKLCQALVQSLQGAASEGTLIMPTFTYSFCDGTLYDVQKSPSRVGVLTEYYRQLISVRRTEHPIFSVAIGGKDVDYFLDVDSDAFGWQSIFGKLHARAAKLVFLGTGLAACTYIHHIEQLYGVPYRYLKTFAGTTRNGSHSYAATATYFVRPLDKNIQLDLSKLEAHLLQTGLMTRVPIGNSALLVIDANQLFEEACTLLDKDINFFLKEPYQL